MATYRAVLMVENTQLATITLNAKNDADAKKQLENSKPPYFEGIGDWKLTKVTDAVTP